MFFSSHVEYVYDHRHLLLEDASRGIVLQQQGLVRKQQGLDLLGWLVFRAYRTPTARGWRRLLDEAR